jgi:hypothetical protein
MLKLTDVSEVHTASIITLMMGAVHTSKTSVNLNVTARRYIPEDSKLHTKLLMLITLHFMVVNSQPNALATLFPET